MIKRKPFQMELSTIEQYLTILSRMVAPSFVMVISPSGLTSNLSNPFGPKDVRKVPATVFAAVICACFDLCQNSIKIIWLDCTSAESDHD